MAHTPAPWHWNSEDAVIENGKGSLEVALVVGFDADGLLIAAAPDLLEAARVALHVARWPLNYTEEQQDAALDAVEAVIARAEGRE